MIRILKKGLHTSIQDLGRIGHRNYGVPISGVMDSISAKLANGILGNAKNDAVMEITLLGPKIEFLTATRIAISGADLSPILNEVPLELNKSISIQKGDVINFEARKYGVRCCLAVAGGLQTDTVLGSKSFYQGITKKAILEKNDIVPFNSTFGIGKSQGRLPKSQSTHFNLQELTIYKGPEFELLNKEQKESLLTKKFTLGINNRMAYQLQEPIRNKLASILSSAVLPGTVQLTPSGKMIILMRDCQTTGGYPRILQLTGQAINSLAQKMQHEVVSFKLQNS